MQNSEELHENRAGKSPAGNGSGKTDSLKKRFAKKRAKEKIIWLAVCAAILAVCCAAERSFEQPSDASARDAAAYELSETPDELPYLRLTALDLSESPEAPTEIDLGDCGDVLAIKNGGEYILSGELNGTIRIDAKDENVHLFFNGVSAASKAGPAILCTDADKLVITLMPETENTLSDAGDYREYSETEACVYAVCPLTINGGGKLSVSGLYEDAVRSKDVLKLLNVNITLRCKKAGLRGNDGAVIKDADVTVFSEKNGIVTVNGGEGGRGDIVVNGGRLSVVAGEYAFKTGEGDLYIADCEVKSKSVIYSYNIAGDMFIQEGCV